jgi:hypothetical protein
MYFLFGLLVLIVALAFLLCPFFLFFIDLVFKDPNIYLGGSPMAWDSFCGLLAWPLFLLSFLAGRQVKKML